jgi:hypothetical protein
MNKLNKINYSRIELTQSAEEIEQRRIESAKKQSYIQDYVKKNNLIKLKSDYFGMSSFYYNKEKDIVLEVKNYDDGQGNPLFFKPKLNIEEHIRELNNL